MMKKILFCTMAMALLSLAFTACGNDETVAAPQITLTEVGHEDSHLVAIGEELHLEADIVAEGVIGAIYVEMHLEEGGEYEMAEEWTEGKYIGVKNTEFHEHIAIPADAPAGTYHLHFAVSDREGNQAQASAEVDVVNPSETHNE